MKLTFPIIMYSTLLSCSGCSSIMSHTGTHQGYYPGTRANIAMIKDNNDSWVITPLLALDLPFTALVDTVLLPYDYWRSNSTPETDSPKARIEQHEALNEATNTIAADDS